MIHLVLFEPRIPQNTGNISRSCVLTGAKLHLIEPMGFRLDESRIKRGGLDYWPQLDLEVHSGIDAFLEKYGNESIYLLSTKAEKTYWEETFPQDVFFLFGREDSGLPAWLHARFSDRRLKIPMSGAMRDRSLNLSNSVAIVLYEALRQRSM